MSGRVSAPHWSTEELRKTCCLSVPASLLRLRRHDPGVMSFDNDRVGIKNYDLMPVGDGVNTAMVRRAPERLCVLS